MKPDIFTKICLVLVIFLLTVVLLRSLFTPSGSYAGEKIEYKVVSLEPYKLAELEAVLNEYGSKGWKYEEIITITDVVIFSR